MINQRPKSDLPHIAVCVDKSRVYGRGVLQGVADYLQQIGPWSICVNHDASVQLSKKWIDNWCGDGIIAYVPDMSIANRLSRSTIHVVDVAGHVPCDDLPQVVHDDRAIGRLVGEHFLERKFRHFAFVGPGDVLADELRFTGLVERVSIERCQRYVYPRRASALSKWENEQDKLCRWLLDLPKPVGLMAFSDIQSCEILDACIRCQLSVPEQVAVVGVDNDEELCRLSRIPLSSVVSNPRRVGFLAAELIDSMISGGKKKHPAARIMVPPLYVQTRFSSDMTAVEDAYVARALTYIQHHAAEFIGIADVARVVGLPRRSLYRRFADSLQRTPLDELRRVRFNRARQLLAETELVINEVARLSGFQSSSYFCRSFHSEFGVTPGEFRQSRQNRHDV